MVYGHEVIELRIQVRIIGASAEKFEEGKVSLVTQLEWGISGLGGSTKLVSL